jgi:hypothetical protein
VNGTVKGCSWMKVNGTATGSPRLLQTAKEAQFVTELSQARHQKKTFSLLWSRIDENHYYALNVPLRELL